LRGAQHGRARGAVRRRGAGTARRPPGRGRRDREDRPEGRAAHRRARRLHDLRARRELADRPVAGPAADRTGRGLHAQARRGRRLRAHLRRRRTAAGPLVRPALARTTRTILPRLDEPQSRKDEEMNLLVTGVEGYIGCLLAPMLQARGHDVVGLDTGYYRDGWLFSDRAMVPGFPRFINRDIREIGPDDVRGVDAVVHLAELSNDPLGENNPELTFQINHQASVRLAELAKAAGASRFVYTSSCSVYGFAQGNEPMTETSPTNPQTAYAKCKTLVERDVAALASPGFSPTFLRNA